jgi:hypothetical protein
MIAPGPGDIVIKKQKPSGFFGTNLASYLTLLGCDSVIVVGMATSGCVRATVVDAFSLNYPLCDMRAKYADVVPTAERAYARGSGASKYCGVAKRPCGSARGREPEWCGRRCRGGCRTQHAVCGAD